MRGNSGNAPLKVLDEEGLATGGKRFRFIPLGKRLQNASARPSALPVFDFDANLTDIAPDDTSFSHFKTALSTEADANITTTFITYHQKVNRISTSLPLLYRNRKKLLEETLLALETSTRNAAEATISISRCLAALSRDLGPEMFYPFFPQVVEAIARVFTVDRERSALPGDSSQKGREQSVLWDPETSVIPLFATLAEITKIILKQLSNDPQKTVAQLSSLLSNPNRRVREMTAEACVGYLVRKTRDTSSVEALASALVQGVTDVSVPAIHELHFTDGLGASLFESLRAPHGRLHSKAWTVVKCAIHSVGCTSEDNEGMSANERKRLSVLARCFRDVSRHLTNESEVNALTDLLICQGKDAMKDNNAGLMGQILFLLRNWVTSMGQSHLALIEKRSEESMFQFLSESLKVFPDDLRVAYEAFGAILSLALSEMRTRPDGGLDKLSSVFMLASEVLGQKGLMGLLHVVLFSSKMNLSVIPAEFLLKAVSPVYERLTRMCTPSCPQIPLHAAVLLFRRLKNAFSRKISLKTFNVPSIERLIVQAPLIPIDQNGNFGGVMTRSGNTTSERSIVVEFLCSVRVPWNENLFDIFLNTCDSWTSAEFPDVLTAFANNFAESAHYSQKEGELDVRRRIGALARDALFCEPLQSVALSRALCDYARSFPSLVKEWLIEDRDQTDKLLSMVSSGLSCSSTALRLQSATLLSFLSSVSSLDSAVDSTFFTDKSVDDVLDTLRCLSDKQPGASVTGVYDAFILLLSIPKSLEAIAGHERVLRELVKTSKLPHIHKDRVKTFLNFSIGLLQTPLKVLWDGARDLWCEMANIDSQIAMLSMMEYLGKCEARLLSTPNINVSGQNGAHQGRLASNPSPIQGDQHDIRHGASRSPNGEGNGVLFVRSQPRHDRYRSLEWDPCEWESHSATGFSYDMTQSESSTRNEDRESLYSATSFVEALKVLSEQPRHTLNFRSKLIASFLKLNSSAHDWKGLHQVLSSFTTLLERMGGLKCSESDKVLEERMRNFLLLNLTKNNVSLQTASVRCICASRSPYLKPHRDSFIRLLSDKTYREELALLTDPLFKQDEESSRSTVDFSDKEKHICDVLTRISFSKIKGKQVKLDSKRSAVLSFLVAKTPWKLAMPMLASLAVAPIQQELSKIETMQKPIMESSKIDDHLHPVPSIQKGILCSIEAIVKNCKRSMPGESWKHLGVATTVLLRKSSKGSAGKAVRSRALSILAEMLKVRPKETEFLVRETLQAVKDAEFHTAEHTDETGVPALMHFIEAVMSSASTTCKAAVLNYHEWALKYCIQAAKNSTAGVKAVNVSLSVGQGLVDTLSELHTNNETATCLSDLTKLTDILGFACNAIRVLFSWITERLGSTRVVVKSWSPTFVRAMSLTTVLANLPSAYFNKFSTLRPLADGLCVFLEMNVGLIESRSKALLALESIVSNTNIPDFDAGVSVTQEVEAFIARLLPLLNMRDIVEDEEAISSLCRIIAKSQSPDLATAGALLQDLYAFDSSKLGEPDYDRRIESLQTINSGFKKALGALDEDGNGIIGAFGLPCLPDDSITCEDITCGPSSFLALLYGCLSAVRMNDTAVRGSSGYSLSLMAKWVASIQEETWTLARTQMFHLLASAVASCKTISVRREYCRSLGETVRWANRRSSEFSSLPETAVDQKWNAAAIFAVMQGLANVSDVDGDFFENLVHLQPHRRGRALRLIGRHMKDFESSSLGLAELKEGSKSWEAVEEFSLQFALPLGLNIALERNLRDDPRNGQFTKHIESREGAQKDVLIWAVDLVGTASGCLCWASYKHFLSSLLRRLDNEKDEEILTMLLKVLVSTSAAYPKSGHVRSPTVHESTNFLTERVIPKMLSYVSPSAVENDVATVSDAHRLLKSNRRGKSAVTFRATVAVAAAELMTFLPVQHLDNHISLLIAPLSGALRSRASAPRDEAKKALTAVVLVLGPKYLNYILDQVLSALKDGFRRDACVYVIHAVLTGIHKFRRGIIQGTIEKRDFSVDSACKCLISFLLKELETGIGESRDDFVDPNVSSERERQSSLRAFKAFECVELLAEHINFEQTARVLIEPVLDAQSHTTSSKLLKKLRNALKHMIQGFSRNQSLEAEAGLTCCYAYANLDDQSDEQEEQGEQDKTSDTMQIERPAENKSGHVHFGLQLLNVIIARNLESMNGTDERGRQLQSMCEPFLRIVAGALTLGNDEVTLTAFRICQKLLKLPLSNRASIADKLSETIVDVLGARSAGVGSHGNVCSSDDLFNACLRAGAVLIHEVGPKGFEVVARERVEALVGISCDCIEHGSVDSRSAAIALLRAVVSKKIMLPCVYDAMEKVKEMAIYVHSTALQKSCIKLCVRFLVTFPLGSKRVRQNVEFFVRNLNYSSASGRIAAVRALETIISEFPQEALEQENEYLFVALTSAGARDTDGESRNRCLECLKMLFQKWDGGRQTDELLRMGARLAGVECSMSKLEDEAKYCGVTDVAVQRAGLVGLTAGGMSGKVKKNQLKAITRVGLMVLQAEAEGSEEDWKTKYRALRCIECCIGCQCEGEKEIEIDEKLFWLWEKMGDLLVDRHEWVRLSACRLVGCHLSAARGKDDEIQEWKCVKGWIWSRNDVVRDIMKNLCVELESSHVSMELAEQAVKNILCMARVMRMDGRIGDMKEMKDEEVDTEMEKGEGLSRTLRWVMTRMCGMASRGGRTQVDLVRRGCGLRFLIVTGTWWGKWIIDKVGGLYIRSVVKVLEDGGLGARGGKGEERGVGGAEVTEGSVIELGHKLQEVVLGNMESDKYYEEYRRVAGRREKMKVKRRRAEAIRGAIDGERAAKKRRRRGERRQKWNGGKRETGVIRGGKLTEEM